MTTPRHLKTYTTAGFTVIELTIVILFLGLAVWGALAQTNAIKDGAHDTKVKTAINAMYYDLQNVYYKKNNSYPESLKPANLVAVDPVLLIDPDGKRLGDKESTYRYESADCTNGACRQFTLKASLKSEADFIKSGKNGK